jgi:hypothetical protein
VVRTLLRSAIVSAIVPAPVSVGAKAEADVTTGCLTRSGQSALNGASFSSVRQLRHARPPRPSNGKKAKLHPKGLAKQITDWVRDARHIGSRSVREAKDSCE